MDRQRSGDYRSLLHEAFGMGRTDGRAAAGLEPTPRGGLCGCLDPEELAALLWAPRPGAPPAGLVLNAPHWYAAGLGTALIDRPSPRVPRPRPRRPAAHDSGARRS